jgi:hypothetical protein
MNQSVSRILFESAKIVSKAFAEFHATLSVIQVHDDPQVADEESFFTSDIAAPRSVIYSTTFSGGQDLIGQEPAAKAQGI